MANMRLTHLFLNDAFPGEANQSIGIPTDGWDNTIDNFNTADDTAKALLPPMPIGAKRQVYTDNINAPGYYTMMYLGYHDQSSVDISADFSDGKFFCSHADTTHAVAFGDGSTPPYWLLARCYSSGGCDATKGMPIAVPCSTSIAGDSSVDIVSTDPAGIGYGHGFGWFWVGGVCPVNDVTLFTDVTLGETSGGKGVDITSLAMHPGEFVMLIDTATNTISNADVSNMTDATGLVGPVVSHGYVDMSAE